MTTRAARPRWLCHVPGCDDPGPHPAPTARLAEIAATRHYDRVHATPPPEDLEDQRAAWNAAGRPRSASLTT